jgi:hypothetical protein
MFRIINILVNGCLIPVNFMLTENNNGVNVPNSLPFLESLCWQTKDVHKFLPQQMLSRYERGWIYRKIFNNLEGEELNFLHNLAIYYKSWLQVEL